MSSRAISSEASRAGRRDRPATWTSRSCWRRTRPELGLPTLDGFEVAEALRATPQGKQMRLIALTGYGQPQDRGRSRGAGFDAHLVKPVEESTLSRAIPGDHD